MSNASDTSPFASRQDARRRVIHLYQTTNLTPRAIAAELGVSRETVYRWLRADRVSRGHDAIVAQDPTNDRLLGISADVADLRRALTILVGQVGRVEEALVRLQHSFS